MMLTAVWYVAMILRRTGSSVASAKNWVHEDCANLTNSKLTTLIIVTIVVDMNVCLICGLCARNFICQCLNYTT